MKKLPDIALDMKSNRVGINDTWLHAESYEEACFVYDALARLRDERNALDAWADAMLEHLGRFPRMPSCATATRPAGDGETK